MLLQQPLPESYLRLSSAETAERCAAAKFALGRRLTILGHHYQRDEVIEYADFTGDSLKLAQLSTSRPEADFIVFCGVHFMAEGAAILSPPHQRVILPDLGAGCSMADMADAADVEELFATLEALLPGEPLVPLTYVNSTAAIKAIVGRRGGSVCTSGNADKLIDWGLAQGGKLIFFPDQHLGRNTCYKLGVPLDQMIVWDPREDLGGNREEALADARVILWKGWCSVHSRMLPEHVHRARAEYPGCRVLVHPECPFETVQLADLAGSTEFIIQQIESAAPGSKWAVGTEIHLVNRLAKRHPEQTIVSLDDCRCQCATMYRITPQHLCWSLEELVAGRVPNEIRVGHETARWARRALETMLDLTAGAPPVRQAA